MDKLPSDFQVRFDRDGFFIAKNFLSCDVVETVKRGAGLYPLADLVAGGGRGREGVRGKGGARDVRPSPYGRNVLHFHAVFKKNLAKQNKLLLLICFRKKCPLLLRHLLLKKKQSIEVKQRISNFLAIMFILYSKTLVRVKTY